MRRLVAGLPSVGHLVGSNHVLTLLPLSPSQALEAQKAEMEAREARKEAASMPKRMKERLSKMKQRQALLNEKEAVKVRVGGPVRCAACGPTRVCAPRRPLLLGKVYWCRIVGRVKAAFDALTPRAPPLPLARRYTSHL